MDFITLRTTYHHRICAEIIRTTWSEKYNQECPNFADVTSRGSIDISWGIVHRLRCNPQKQKIAPQTIGRLFELLTQEYLEQAFGLLQHLRPGKWTYSTKLPISQFDQYSHLAQLEELIDTHSELASTLGTDYIIKPDIVIARSPIADDEINAREPVIGHAHPVARNTPLRQANSNRLILHASISCKWTIRSDRAQNPRTEALNLIRNRKGHTPHIVMVTAEPLPMRIASIALGTGDLDCVYHFALPELQESVSETQNEDQQEMLETLVQGRRLRDISDLPFDLAI